MTQIDLDSTRVWGIIGLIVTFVLWLLAILIGPHVNKEWPTRFGAALMRNRVASSVCLLVAGLVIWAAANHSERSWEGAVAIMIVFAMKLVRDKTSEAKKLDVAETKLAAAENQLASLEIGGLSPSVEVRFQRFENIERIVYGHIAYSPLLDHDEKNQPHGVGIELLEMIFRGKKIEALDSKALWSDFVDELSSGRCDIIATPIFETRERSTRIAFCSPMFYSDIGMYVKKTHIIGRLGPASLSFDEVIETVKAMKLQVQAIEGEISGKMAMKYLGLDQEDKDKWLNPNKASVTSLINAINRKACDVAFAEVFQAEQSDPVKSGEVINILKPKALLYPVSFAVRKEDYVLRRYINLKLLELEETLPDGVLTVVFEELKRHEPYKHYTLEDVKRYFVRDYPAPGIRHDVLQTSSPTNGPPPDNGKSGESPLGTLLSRDEIVSPPQPQVKCNSIGLKNAFAEG